MLDYVRSVDLFERVVRESTEIGSISHVINTLSRISIEHLPTRGSDLSTDMESAWHDVGLRMRGVDSNHTRRAEVGKLVGPVLICFARGHVFQLDTYAYIQSVFH